MAGADADAASIGPDCFNSVEAYNKAATHHVNLSKRPDFDGIVTINEGVRWALENPNIKESSNAMMYYI